MRSSVAILAAAILAMPARSLAAEEPSGVAFRFEYAARPGCMGREDFVDTWLRAAFGGEVVRDDARALVRVEIRRNGTRPEAHVTAFDENGVEHWRAIIPTEIDCRELIQDTAYSLSANLGQWDLKRQPVPEWLLYRKPVNVRMPAPSLRPRAFLALVPPAPSWLRTPLIARTQPIETEEKSQAVRLEFAAAGLVVPYGLPNVSFGAALAGGVRWRNFSAALEFRGVASLEETFSDIPVTALMLSGTGALCANARTWLRFCGLFGGGQVGISFGAPAEPLESTASVLVTGARLAYVHQIAYGASIQIFGEALVPIQRSRIQLTRSTTETFVWEMPILLPAVGVSVILDAL